MKKQLCALLLALSCTVLCAGGNQNTGIPSKECFFLVLMVGQSNMAGRGIPEAAYKVANSRIVKMERSGK